MKIVCVGRNYLDHIHELKNDVPAEPVIFFKPESAIAGNNNRIPLPRFTGSLHYECELILRFNREVPLGHSVSSFHEVCKEWTLGIDFTARELQEKLKNNKLPWELAKAFDNAAVIGQWQAITDPDVYDTSFTLNKNGEPVQRGNLRQLIFNFEDIINYCTQFFSFREGDILFTGTPEGVGPVQSGDVLTGTLQDQQVIELSIL